MRIAVQRRHYVCIEARLLSRSSHGLQFALQVLRSPHKKVSNTSLSVGTISRSVRVGNAAVAHFTWHFPSIVRSFAISPTRRRFSSMSSYTTVCAAPLVLEAGGTWEDGIGPRDSFTPRRTFSFALAPSVNVAASFFSRSISDLSSCGANSKAVARGDHHFLRK